MTTMQKLAKMTDEQYERWLKRNGYRGMAAFAMDQKRKVAKQEASK